MISVLKPGIINQEVFDSINSLIKQLNPSIDIKDIEYLRSAATSQNTVIAYAEKNDRIIGIAILCHYKTLSGCKGWIEDVVVDENYRKKGIGSQLIDFLMNIASEKKLDSIFLTSNPLRTEANNLYLKMGFQICETNMYFITSKGQIR